MRWFWDVQKRIAEYVRKKDAEDETAMEEAKEGCVEREHASIGTTEEDIENRMR